MEYTTYDLIKDQHEADDTLTKAFNGEAEHSVWQEMRQAWSAASRKEKAIAVGVVATLPITAPVIGFALWRISKMSIPCAASGGY